MVWNQTIKDIGACIWSRYKQSQRAFNIQQNGLISKMGLSWQSTPLTATTKCSENNIPHAQKTKAHV